MLVSSCNGMPNARENLHFRADRKNEETQKHRSLTITVRMSFRIQALGVCFPLIANLIISS